MNVDIVAALLMGLAGSGHCLAMCGGLAGAMGMRQNPWRLAIYNLGRITSYGLAGLLVGGAIFSISGVHPDFLIYLRALAGIMMVLLALYLLRFARALLWLERLGAVLWRRLQPLGRKFSPDRKLSHVFAAGMLWGWLPCGLVYSALTWSALAGHPAEAGLFMLIFGVGTLPSMWLTGVFSYQLNHVLASTSFRWVAGLLLAGYGIVTLLISIKQLS